eukprot:128147-Chlamydomonas_euryale.AAC.1
MLSGRRMAKAWAAERREAGEAERQGRGRETRSRMPCHGKGEREGGGRDASGGRREVHPGPAAASALPTSPPLAPPLHRHNASSYILCPSYQVAYKAGHIHANPGLCPYRHALAESLAHSVLTGKAPVHTLSAPCHPPPPRLTPYINHPSTQ